MPLLWRVCTQLCLTIPVCSLCNNCDPLTNFWSLDFERLESNFIALIHPIQWTIANPVGADRPAKRQKKTSCVSTGWPVPVLCIRQVAHGIYFLSRQHDVIASFSFGACTVRTCFQQSPDILRKSVHYDGFLTLYMDMFSVEVLPTDQARIYI